MAKLYDISDWYEILYFSTGGTRNKKVYINPIDGDQYFFKESLKTKSREYKYEFWSEIIASEVGLLLGFDILPYHIAIKGNLIGCISKSMINQESQELIEGGKYLQAFDTTFNPEDKKKRDEYTFQLIYGALFAFKKEKHLKELIETIVFDALIGNSDRHQENWATINVHAAVSASSKEIEKGIITGQFDEKISYWLKKIVSSINPLKGKKLPKLESLKLMLPRQTIFAPIYDSGCSFGRELDDDRIVEMLNNPLEIEKYVAKGLSEIHWEKNKISHYELLKRLLQIEGLKDFVLAPLKRIMEQFNKEKISQLVFNVDSELVVSGNPNSFPKKRKEMVIKLLTLRFNKLREIYSQYQ